MQGWEGHSGRCCDLERGFLHGFSPLLHARPHLPCLGTKPLVSRKLQLSSRRGGFHWCRKPRSAQHSDMGRVGGDVKTKVLTGVTLRKQRSEFIPSTASLAGRRDSIPLPATPSSSPGSQPRGTPEARPALPSTEISACSFNENLARLSHLSSLSIRTY